MERKPKTIFQLDTPFTTVQWPTISEENQVTILDLLCSLLAPIGKHRSLYVTPSKGTRSKKRKRREAVQTSEIQPSQAECTPPTPEISSSVMVGLNSITRSLESLSRMSKNRDVAQTPVANLQDEVMEDRKADVEVTLEAAVAPETTSRHFAAVFVSRSSQPAILNAHLPQLIATASLAHPDRPPTKLVPLSRSAESQLCTALGLPRVSFVGLLDDAPYSKALLDLIRDNVSDIEVPWLKEAQMQQYRSLKVNAVQTTTLTVTKKAVKQT
ncbi:hypothetical protein BP6252_12818 [Coleophoma cylindrospora]|uniref:Uncharacterized protein n=1 Tax=Coleophoma cylindrospora TaxID=1849047 RepID=A0A3D8QDE7_9HELO|nr:hypothetical protein BP6252_12818 [Coleophoma cylindrospora]